MVYVMEELVEFTLLTRGTKDYMADRYSEHIESTDNLIKWVNENLWSYKYN